MLHSGKKKPSVPSVATAIALAALLSTAAVAYVAWQSFREMSKEIAGLRTQVEKADIRLERAEVKLVTLQEDGYVEKPELASLSALVKPSIVFILSSEATEDDTSGYLESESVVTEKEETELVVGTGFVVTEDGYIGTATHVLRDLPANSIRVKDTDGRYHTARFVAASERADVALLKVDGGTFEPVDLGYFQNIRLGEDVGVMGHTPGFLAPLLAKGNVSAGGLVNGTAIFTINAFVNKGNSGSPVFSLKTGRVLGIISARGRTPALIREPIDLGNLPPSGLKIGNVDPIRLSAKLYNDTLAAVADTAQIGIGIVYPVDELRTLLREQ